MSSKPSQPSANSQRGVVAVAGVVIVSAVAGVAIWRVSGSPKKAPGLALCQAIQNVASYNAAHPPKHTYPDLNATLTYAHSQYAAVSSVPTSQVSNLSGAISSSEAMIKVIHLITSHQKFTVGQDKASFKQILLWRKTTKALTSYQQSNCK
jgi:hypothetical protein